MRSLNIPSLARFSTACFGLRSSVPITFSTTTDFFVIVYLISYHLTIFESKLSTNNSCCSIAQHCVVLNTFATNPYPEWTSNCCPLSIFILNFDYTGDSILWLVKSNITIRYKHFFPLLQAVLNSSKIIVVLNLLINHAAIIRFHLPEVAQISSQSDSFLNFWYVFSPSLEFGTICIISDLVDTVSGITTTS